MESRELVVRNQKSELRTWELGVLRSVERWGVDGGEKWIR